MLRKYHRIISLIVALPLALIVLSGLILQLRQQFDFIQPKTITMEKNPGVRFLTIEEMIVASNEPPENIDQIIFKPKKFHLAMRLVSGNEIQIHPQTGEILKNSPRYTNFLIDLHQGSFLGNWYQYLIVFPTGLALAFLLISGLLIYPWRNLKREK